MNYDGVVVIGTEMDTSGAEKDAIKLQKLLDAQFEREHRFDDFWNDFSDGAKEAGENVEQIEINTEQVEKTLKKVSEVNLKQIGKSMQNMVKSTVRWGLAIFGIRGAYMAVRNAMNTITANDKQLANDIKFIKTALAYVLEPVIRAIVNLMKTLAQYVQYVVYAWTKRDIFASARKNLQAGEKSAKSINKSMSGFDEATTLQSNQTSNSSISGIGGIGQLEGGDVPKWLDFIVKNKDTIISALSGIAGGLIAVKLGLTGIQGLGIGLALTGIVYTIQKIIEFIKDPSFENFIGILKGIALTVAGVGVAFGLWPLAIGAAVALAMLIIVENYDKILDLFNKAIEWLEGPFYDRIEKWIGPLAATIFTPISQVVNAAKELFISFYGGIKKVIGGIVKLFKGDFKNGIKEVFGGLINIMLAPLNGLIGGINGLIKGINKINITIPDWVPLVGGQNWGFSIPTIPQIRLAKGGIVNLPGRGVPVGAMAGERGQEGIIPLSDTQQMERIGQAIGRYVTINLTNITRLDARQIAKETRKVSAENDFATNS